MMPHLKRNPVRKLQGGKLGRARKAARLYQDFSGHMGEFEVDRVQFRVPDTAVVIGTLDYIGYTTVRDGQVEKYDHKFQQPGGRKALLCVSPDGTQLLIVGGNYQFTERGIEDR